jgi:ubiquinone/menaquinone biosynthesis C-methylase UbiE
MTDKQLELVNKGFSRKADAYQYLNIVNPIVKFNRAVIYSHTLKYLNTGDNILELNAGTGEDAEFFAKRGFNIYVTDIAEKMLEKLNEKAKVYPNITSQRLSYNEMRKVENKPFDYIFSNLGGFNLEKDLKHAFSQVPHVLKKNGFFTMVTLSKFCFWELLNLFWSPSVAFRRIPSWFGKGVKTRVGQIPMTTYYHDTKQLSKWLGSNFTLLEIQGVSVIVPPTYFESLPQRLPRIFKYLTRLDVRLNQHPPFNRIGDFMILTFKHTG